MKIIEKTININSFNIEANVFLYENGEISLTSNSSNIGYFDILSNGILLLDNNQKVINTNSYPNISNNFIWCFGTVSKSFLLLVDEGSLDFDTFKYTKSAIYSVSEQKIVCSSSVVGDVIFDDYVFAGLGDTEISYYKIEAEPVIHTFKLSTLGTFIVGEIEEEYQISDFSGIYKNTLVCTLSNGDILLLDLEKCEVKLLIEEGVINNLYQKSEGTPIFLGLDYRTFIEIDVEKGSVIRKIDLSNQLRQLFKIPEDKVNWAHIGTAIYKDSLFYFRTENYVAIFDPKTEKIVDSYSFDKDGVTIRSGREFLQAKDNKIYCLDMSNTLHVLEREELSI